MNDDTFLQGGYIVLDTNVLIDAIKYPEEFESFFDLLIENNCSAVLDSVVKFEFLRGARTQGELDDINDFFKIVYGAHSSVLKIDSKLMNIARKLVWCCHFLENKQINLPDALIGAQILKYTKGAGNLLLATQNHRDFHPAIFERKLIHNVELPDGKIKTISIYDNHETSTGLLEKAPAM